MGEHHDGGTHSTAVTKYDTSHMGKHGKFVVHSKLPGNEHHQDLAKHSNSDVTLDDDKITFKPTHVDVKDEAAKLKGLNHELLNTHITPKLVEHAVKIREDFVQKFNLQHFLRFKYENI